MKTFNVPITHPYIQGLTEFDLNFIDWSAALDDPKLREKIENTVYDDDFDSWFNEQLENEIADGEKGEETSGDGVKSSPPEDTQFGAKRGVVDSLPDRSINTPKNANLGGLRANNAKTTNTDDWEEVT